MLFLLNKNHPIVLALLLSSPPGSIGNPCPAPTSCIMAAQYPTSAQTNPHTVITVQSDTQPSIRSAVKHQLFNGPEVAKVLLQFDVGAIVAILISSSNHAIPESYFYAITTLLYIGFFSLLVAILVHQVFPRPAETLVHIGSVCVVSAVPVIAAGFRLKLSFLLLILTILILIAVFWIQRKRVSEASPEEGEVERSASNMNGSQEDVGGVLNGPKIWTVDKGEV